MGLFAQLTAVPCLEEGGLHFRIAVFRGTIRRLCHWAATEVVLKVDVKRMSERLAHDRSVSDYEVWRALQAVNDELHEIERQQNPIPIDLVFARAILRRAQQARGCA